MNKIKYSIVIPCYNEGNNLKQLFNNLKKINFSSDSEVIIIDNGSTDNSSKLLVSLKNQMDIHNLRIITNEINIGYGHGILTGLDESKGEFLGWTHADLQTDISDVLKGFEIINKNQTNVIVKGKRIKRSIFDNIFTGLMSIVCRIVLKENFKDINAQPKIFSKKFFQQIRNNAPEDFSLDLYFLYKAKKMNYTIIDFPVFFNKRLFGEAKGGGSIGTKINLSMRTFNYILETKKNEKK
tara:strand:+ start:2704 stop:3420 length:717 start_codon:yes stop_codon:yes gene_type:complete